jgi:hypothetical protein
MDIKETGFEVVGRIHLDEDWTQWRARMDTVVIKHLETEFCFLILAHPVGKM